VMFFFECSNHSQRFGHYIRTEYGTNDKGNSQGVGDTNAKHPIDFKSEWLEKEERIAKKSGITVLDLQKLKMVF